MRRQTASSAAPADVTSTAIGTPLGIIYDYDGTVTDAILGEGAGALDECFFNAVYGAPDNFSASGNIVHAVAIINGVCASTSTQLPDVQYRLVRVLGNIFGLAWSQANDNVLTGDPPPGAADYAGFPVMHFLDPIDCVPITLCYPNPAVPKMDDVTALARLYPAPGGNPLATGRIWGDVYFTNAAGSPEQQMQGVNVVARLIDSTGNPSRQYVVTSVSGFEFVGNAGNIVTGYDAPNGLPFNRFGSDNASVEGFYDLGELTIPSGQNIAEYQISVEAIDPNWSWGVQPYGPTQVAPSGSFAPVVVTIQSGSNVERDISMLGSEDCRNPSRQRLDLHESRAASARRRLGVVDVRIRLLRFFRVQRESQSHCLSRGDRARRNRCAHRVEASARHRHMGIERRNRRSCTRRNAFGI